MADFYSLSQTKSPMRPPWTTEAQVHENCTSCGDCLAVCPEGILVAGRAGTPVVSLQGEACTFCGRCAEVCTEDVFSSVDTKPWAYIATVESACLLHQGVSCQSCTDSCDEDAIRLDYSAGRVGAIVVQADSCTGCGACLGVCPTNALSLTQPLERRTQ